ncbi:MAG TPA: type II toxin-antitoxin system VapC family toxin [Usitatibacter sp.]|jgi:PIN domain nuclease of toxin-antitoxin system
MSRFLVDTQLLLWNVSASRKLPARVARLFRDGRHEFFYSAVSLWEIAIKAALGRDDFIADAATILEALDENGFHELSITARHAVAVSRLPVIHGDPFDRMLVAQAIGEPMALITTDERLAAYPGMIEVV